MMGREKGVTVERDKDNTANTGAGSIDIDEEVSVLQDGGIEQMTFEDICALLLWDFILHTLGIRPRFTRMLQDNTTLT